MFSVCVKLRYRFECTRPRARVRPRVDVRNDPGTVPSPRESGTSQCNTIRDSRRVSIVHTHTHLSQVKLFTYDDGTPPNTILDGGVPAGPDSEFTLCGDRSARPVAPVMCDLMDSHPSPYAYNEIRVRAERPSVLCFDQ